MTAEITEEPVLPVQEAEPPPDDAPYGYMTDPVTGERRPKKRPGRRSKTARPPSGATPPLEDLQALGSLPEASEDTAPGAPPKGKRKSGPKVENLPPFRAGVISKGVNGLYRKAGRLARMFDPDLGNAIIAITRADDEDDVTVGDAWEEVAKTNPRIRAFLLKIMARGAMAELFRVHLPIFLVIMMKPAVQKRLPILKLADVLLTDEPDPDGEGYGPQPSDLAQMMGGINPQDMAQMMAMAQGFMGQVVQEAPRPANGPREPVASHPDFVPPTFRPGVNGMEHPADQG